MKSIVIFYSLSGKTELVAKAIAETIKADIRKIEEIKQRKGIIGFLLAGRDAMKLKCSEIKPLDIDIAGYDLIFLGTPVWAFRPAPAINTFISSADLSNKKVILFVTMGGSGDKSTIKIMSDAIKAKGGSVLNSFAIRTSGIKDTDIEEEGRKIGNYTLLLKNSPDAPYPCA